jgi:predicted nucleic acid-binding protein
LTPKFGGKETSGMTEHLTTPVVYIDANPFMYAIEGDEKVSRPIKEFFALLRQRPGIAVTSELTLAEVLPKATMPDVQRSYFNLIVWSKIFDLRPVTREILIETAKYRRATATLLPDKRTKMVRLPDAIHMVTAIQSGCKKILSLDSGLKVQEGVSVIEPNQAGLSQLTRDIS